MKSKHLKVLLLSQKRFPKLKFIIISDGLYISYPIIKICENNDWDYIFRLKSELPKTITQDLKVL